MFLSLRHFCSFFSFILTPAASQNLIMPFVILFCSFCAFPAQAQDAILLDSEAQVGWFRIVTARYDFSANDQARGVLLITGNETDKNYSGYVFCNGNWYPVKSGHSFTCEILLGTSNQLFIFLYGDRGASVHISVLQEENPTLGISIQMPLDGETILRPDIMVSGTVDNPSGVEASVKVNGIAALVVGNRFSVNHLPVKEGENTITAQVSDLKGSSATSVIMISAVPTDNHLKVTADRESGVAPFETSITVGGSCTIIEHLLFPSGPGVVEFLHSSNNTYKIRITDPGLYFFAAEGVDNQNNTYKDSIAIAVSDPARVDALCRAGWENMRTALINGDIEQALTYHHGSRRTRYNEIYNALGNDLPSLVQQMREITPVKIDGQQAKYRIRQDHDIEGRYFTATYYIYFSQDENGFWRIAKY